MPENTPVVMRFLGLCNALVTVTRRDPAPHSREAAYTAECTGCLATLAEDPGFMPPKFRALIDEAREWANKHATTCRALPAADSGPGRETQESRA